MASSYLGQTNKNGVTCIADDIDTRQFNPAAIWKRICQRHWDRETNIDEIAEQRKGWNP